MAHEINLLPPDRRTLLLRQAIEARISRFLRSLLAGLGVVTVIGLVAIIVLRGLLVTSGVDSVAALEAEVARYHQLRDTIAARNVVLEKMQEVQQDAVVWSRFFHDVLAAVPAGIEINRFSGQVGQQSAQFTIAGRAVNRNTLIITEDRLNQLSWVARIEAPQTNLIRREFPEYTFTLILDRNDNDSEREENERQ